MGFAVSAPVAFTPLPRPSVPSFAHDEPSGSSSPAPFPAAPPAVPSQHVPAPQGFDAIPDELLAAQQAERRRLARRRRIENAMGWTILAAVLVSVGLLAYANREGIARTLGEAQTGASPDPSRQGSYMLRLVSDPPGATVFEGGVEIGRTPLEFEVARMQVVQRPRQFVFRAPGRVDTRAVVGNHPTPRAELRITLPAAVPRR